MVDTDDDDDLNLRFVAQESARAFLANCSGFALAQVKAVDGIVALHEQDPSLHNLPYRSKGRAAHCIKLLDIRAQALIGMLTNESKIDLHTAIITELGATRDRLWTEFSGLPLWGMLQIGKGWRRAMDRRIGHWTVEAYRKMAGAQPQAPKTEAVPIKPPKLRSRLEPKIELLRNPNVASLGRQNAALALGVSARHLDRLTKAGKLTAIGPSTRKRYAVSDLKRFLNEKN